MIEEKGGKRERQEIIISDARQKEERPNLDSSRQKDEGQSALHLPRASWRRDGKESNLCINAVKCSSSKPNKHDQPTDLQGMKSMGTVNSPQFLSLTTGFLTDDAIRSGLVFRSLHLEFGEAELYDSPSPLLLFFAEQARPPQTWSGSAPSCETAQFQTYYYQHGQEER
mmetsp:Transcript_3542/g.5040  ORF Transcript_3542/g.5040 Transcript_3542/m.5040 type:complete len:169 (-) Transcript_3542:604-1110(-)